MDAETYPQIADYACIADCHSAALISKSGSIDWCCMPRVDSRSCFARLLGWPQGGYCRISPSTDYTVTRRYIENSLVLETTFHVSHGEVRLLDCFTMRKGGRHVPYGQILRILEGVRGEVPIACEVLPRFDYGAIRPWIHRMGRDSFSAIGGADGLVLSGDMPVEMQCRHDLVGRFSIRAGQRHHLSILWRPPEDLEAGSAEVPGPQEMDHRLQQTLEWWRRWAGRCTYQGPYGEHVWRSAVVLKGLTHAPTGAVVAAPTTSLPEAMGGSRNWDYRYSWVRDSTFAVRSLTELGYEKEVDEFRQFIERSSAGAADQLQIVYGVDGRRGLMEVEIDNLEGYRHSRPVRVGNAAEKQIQMDVYGEIMDLAWQWHRRGRAPDADYWEFLVSLVNQVCTMWRQPDRGMWEIRGEPRHFVLSKAMCWAALDRGIKLSQELGREVPLKVWQQAQSEIRRAVEQAGYDSRRGVFTQAFDHPSLDASLLLLPTVGFISYDDDRMRRTTEAIRTELDKGGFVCRYPEGDDGLEGDEGVFLACSFWLVDCLSRQGRMGEARRLFEAAAATANDLRLFSEEYDPSTGQMLGNFPQALTHLSLITAAMSLAQSGHPDFEGSGVGGSQSRWPPIPSEGSSQ
jgi:GH15 family glucan-1,4-alpha-glucosidase